MSDQNKLSAFSAADLAAALSERLAAGESVPLALLSGVKDAVNIVHDRKAREDKDAQLKAKFDVFTRLLEDIAGPDYTAGEVHVGARTPFCEQIGVYKNGAHVFDVYSNGSRFVHGEFENYVRERLGIQSSRVEDAVRLSPVPVVCTQAVYDVILSHGMRLNGGELLLNTSKYQPSGWVSADFGSDPDNRLVEFTSNDQSVVIVTMTERSGRKISYEIHEGVFRKDLRKEWY